MNDANPQTPADLADRTLVLTRIFDAPRHLVYEAWTRKEHLDRWSAPKNFKMASSDADLRPGGHWQIHMVAPDGEDFRAGGIYQEIVPGERLVFTHAWEGDDGTPEHETLVTVRFADHGEGQTRMTFEQGSFKSVESRNNHQGGWSECFDLLADLLRENES